jgi:NhaA family Na+:H+ antiporter
MKHDYQPLGPVLDPWMRFLLKFLKTEATSGILLLMCTVLALLTANSPWSSAFTDFWQTKVGLTIGSFQLYKPLLLWINDGLMTIFFFVIGLEIKREIVFGELRNPRKAALPVAAALGGMLVPAAIYLSVIFLAGGGLNSDTPGVRGWGVPMATDIAFVVGFLALLGSRVPLELKIFLLTLAIVDDLGAILVIAVGYSVKTSLIFLLIAVASFVLIVLVRLIGVRMVPFYVLLGAASWLAFLKSGVHPTVAGVVLGVLTPATPWIPRQKGAQWAQDLAKFLADYTSSDALERVEVVRKLSFAARETIAPLDRLEIALHPWVALVIMPLFALANAGVQVELSSVQEPVAWAVVAGLFVGKPLGILAFSVLAVQCKLAQLPRGVNWGVLLGASFLAGIGFTMSLFIAGLALENQLLLAGKIGTLIGSTLSAVCGMGILLYFLRGSGVASGEESSA